jgi:hypothetical protein
MSTTALHCMNGGGDARTAKLSETDLLLLRHQTWTTTNTLSLFFLSKFKKRKMATSKTPRANRRTSRATTPSRVGQRPATRSTAQTPKQSNLGTRFLERNQDDASEVPDLLEEGGTKAATSLSFDSSGGSPASGPGVAGVVPKPPSNEIQQQEVHLQEAPETRGDKNTQVQAVQKTRTRGRARSATPRRETRHTRSRARSATPRADSGTGRQLQLARDTRSSDNDRRLSPHKAPSAPAANSAPSHFDANKTKPQDVQKKRAGKKDRDGSPATAAASAIVPQPQSVKTQPQSAQKKDASKKNRRSRRRSKAAAVVTAAAETSALVPHPNSGKTQPQPVQKTSASKDKRPKAPSAAAATYAVVPGGPSGGPRGRSKPPPALSSNDQDRAASVPGPPKLPEEVGEQGPDPSDSIVPQSASKDNQLQTVQMTDAAKNHPGPRPPSPPSNMDQDRAGPVPGSPKLPEEVGEQGPATGGRFVPQPASSETLLAAVPKASASESGTQAAASSAGQPLSLGCVVGQHASNEYKLLLRLQERLDNNEREVRDIFEACFITLKNKRAEAVMGRGNLGYLLSKLNFRREDMLSNELQSIRCSDELHQLTEGATMWAGVRVITPDGVQPAVIDYMMDLLRLVSKNVRALRIFTGFLVHVLAELTMQEELALLAKLGILADGFGKKKVAAYFKVLFLHLVLNRLYGSDIGSSTVNFRLCCVKSEGLKTNNEPDDGLEWPWGDEMSDRCRGLDFAPGCEAIDNRISPPQDWGLAIDAVKTFVLHGPVINDACASPEETLEHFSALVKRCDPAKEKARDLFLKGVSFLRENTPEQVPWRIRASELAQAILDVTNQENSSGLSSASAIQARLSRAASTTPGVEAMYPLALGFVAHSPTFLEWTKDYLKKPKCVDQIGEEAMMALTRAVSEVESGAPTSDIDPRFSGHLITLDSLSIVKVLGSGSFGTVVLGFSKDGARYLLAVKLEVIDDVEEFGQYFWRSLVCMFTVNSRNVASLYSYGSFKVTPQSGHMVNGNGRFTPKAETFVGTLLFMEVGGDTLRHELDKRNKQPVSIEGVIIESLRNVLQILNGLVALHKINWIHRDIKPANVVRGHHGELQIVDLGLSRLMGSEKVATKKAGTPGYKPLEFRGTKGYFDVFSVGVILFEVSNIDVVQMEMSGESGEISQLLPYSQSVATGLIRIPSSHPLNCYLMRKAKTIAR